MRTFALSAHQLAVAVFDYLSKHQHVIMPGEVEVEINSPSGVYRLCFTTEAKKIEQETPR